MTKQVCMASSGASCTCCICMLHVRLCRHGAVSFSKHPDSWLTWSGAVRRPTAGSREPTFANSKDNLCGDALKPCPAGYRCFDGFNCCPDRTPVCGGKCCGDPWTCVGNTCVPPGKGLDMFEHVDTLVPKRMCLMPAGARTVQKSATAQHTAKQLVCT